MSSAMTSPPPYSYSSVTSPIPNDDKKYDFSASHSTLPTYQPSVTPNPTNSPAPPRNSQEQVRIWGANVGAQETKSSVWGAARNDNHEQGSGWGKAVDGKVKVPSPWGRGVGGDAPSSKWWKKSEQNAEARGTTNVWGAAAGN